MKPVISAKYREMFGEEQDIYMILMSPEIAYELGENSNYPWRRQKTLWPGVPSINLLPPNSKFTLSFPFLPHWMKPGPCKLHFSFAAGQQGPLVGMARLEETICVLVWHGFPQFSPQQGSLLLQLQLGGRHFQWIYSAAQGRQHVPCHSFEFPSSLLAPSSLDPQGGCCFLLSCFRVF